MKKYLLSISAIVLTAGTLVFTGCKKDDVTAPEVTLNGPATMTLVVGKDNYQEQGATATDDKDGALTATTTDKVNDDLVGTYVLTYSATDAAGNTGEATRTVIVRNEADIYEGTYKCENPAYDTLSPWTQVITASKTKNNVITFNKFAARTGNTSVTAELIGGTTFTVIPATVPGLGKNGCTFSYTANGTGATITKIAGKYTFSLKYFEARIATGSLCTAISATPFEDKFTQQ